MLVPRDGSPPIRAESQRVTALVDDGLARTTVRQTFVNRNGRPLEAGARIFTVLNDTDDTSLKGYCAVALGMMRHTDAKEALRALVLDDRDPKLRLQAVRALGLMGDTETVKLLVGGLRNAKTLGVISSYAKALGLIGHRSAIGPLTQLVRDQKAPGLARGFACVALGLIASKSKVPWNSSLSQDANYRTVVGAQYEILDLL